MISNKKQIRLGYVHRLINRQGYPTLADCSKGLGVSEKTIQRLLKDLRDLYGADIRYCRLREGYFYRTKPTGISPALEGVQTTEEDRVCLALSAKVLEFLALKDEAEDLRKWIHQITGESLDIPLRELDRIISFGEQRRTFVLHRDLQILLNSILKQRTVQFLYNTAHSGECGLRVVDPYHLTYRDAAWYLIGYSHEREAIRTFSLVRCGDIRQHGDSPFPDRKFHPDEHFRDAGIIQNGKSVQVHLRFHPSIVERIDERDHQFDFIKRPWRDDQGFLHMLFRHRLIEALASTVMSFGPEVEVIKPVRLRNLIRTKLQQALKQY